MNIDLAFFVGGGNVVCKSLQISRDSGAGVAEKIVKFQDGDNFIKIYRKTFTERIILCKMHISDGASLLPSQKKLRR